MADTIGMVPNQPSEQFVPINTWNLLLVGESPFMWAVSLDTMDGRQYKLWKDRSLLVRPDIQPSVGSVVGFSISTADAQAAGLLPPSTETPPYSGRNPTLNVADLPPEALALDADPTDQALTTTAEAGGLIPRTRGNKP